MRVTTHLGANRTGLIGPKSAAAYPASHRHRQSITADNQSPPTKAVVISIDVSQ